MVVFFGVVSATWAARADAPAGERAAMIAWAAGVTALASVKLVRAAPTPSGDAAMMLLNAVSMTGVAMAAAVFAQRWPTLRRFGIAQGVTLAVFDLAWAAHYAR
jgi:hypothetical protein